VTVTTLTGTDGIKSGGNLVWRIAGFILAVTLIVIASGYLGGIAGHWIK
jgi:hypothetical protein